jgi:hypothetical protein
MKPEGKFLYVVVTTFLLIASGVGLAVLWERSPRGGWVPDQVYAVWIEGIEVSPSEKGEVVNGHHAAPRLKATLTWRDTVLLETPEAARGLIARWDRTVVRVTRLLKNELSPNVMENVARIHANPDETISVEVKDLGVVRSRSMGIWKIPCKTLRPGVNLIEPTNNDSAIRSMTLQVVPSQILERNGRLPESRHSVREGVVMIPSPSDGVGGMMDNPKVRRVLDEIKERGKAVSDLLQKRGENP